MEAPTKKSEADPRRMSTGIKFFLGWWLILLGVGLIFNFWMALKLFRAGETYGGILFSVFGVGCIVYLYRTYSMRDEMPRDRPPR
jgi:uncharacterized membrane protein YeiB